MPKPVQNRKPTKKKKSAKRPSSDPNLRAHQLMREMEAKQADVFPTTEAKSFEDQFKARMSELGRKGGKASGAGRMSKMTPAKRSEVARKAALEKWKRARTNN